MSKLINSEPTVIGAVVVPVTASKPISAISISWSAAILPAISPTPPPTLSTPIPATVATGFLSPAFKTLPVTPLAILPVNPSTNPIAIPLPTALRCRSATFSSSSNKDLTALRLRSSPTSCCNNSEKVKEASIAAAPPPIAPPIAPVIVPAPGIILPATAPVPAAAAADKATSSDLKEPIWVAIELTSKDGIMLGLLATPFIKPKTPDPFSS